MTTIATFLLSTALKQLRSLPTELIARAIYSFRSELEHRSDADHLFAVWHVEDVFYRRPDLTVDQCREVLCLVDRSINPEIGINWDVIDSMADDLYPKPDNLDELREAAVA